MCFSDISPHIHMIEHPPTFDFIERHEKHQGYSMHQFTSADWKLVHAVFKMKKKQQEFDEHKRSRRIVVLDTNLDSLFDQSYLAFEKKNRKKPGKYREGFQCPVTNKKTGKPCGNRVKIGHHICGKHNRPTDIEYSTT